MFVGERAGLEVFKGVFNCFGMYETSKRPTWAMNPVNIEGELLPCFFKQGTGMDDVIMLEPNGSNTVSGYLLSGPLPVISHQLLPTPINSWKLW